MANDYYKTLELNRNASDADIKKAYRRLALKFHPKCNTETGSESMFLELGEAYDVLSDPRKKALYDKFGEEGLKGGIPLGIDRKGAWTTQYAYHGIPEKTFMLFFGGDNPFADFHTNDAVLQCEDLRPVLVKTQDPPIERDLHLSLDDLFHGCVKKIKISRRIMHDDGVTSSIKDKILSIDVRPGWKEDTRIVFPKEGDQGPNTIPADIVFIVRQMLHPLYERQNDDLIYTAQISLEMALTGFSVNVDTLDGRFLKILITDVVHPAYEKVVPGEGMPLALNPSKRGNLVIHFEIQFPEKLSPERKALIKQALK